MELSRAPRPTPLALGGVRDGGLGSDPGGGRGGGGGAAGVGRGGAGGAPALIKEKFISIGYIFKNIHTYLPQHEMLIVTHCTSVIHSSSR